MLEITPTAEWIQNNFDNTLKVVKSSGLEEMELMLSRLDETYSMSPASSKKEYGSCFPGGLCFHNLHVLKWFNKFASIMSEEKIPMSTMIKLSILHEIGKVGNKQEPYYIRNDGSYFDDKGLYYSINPKLQYMKIVDRSLYLAQKFNVPLTEQEYLAIKLSDEHDEETKSYKYKEPQLALILQNAVSWSRKLEKDNIIRWPK